jgi:hypothetical protein
MLAIGGRYYMYRFPLLSVCVLLLIVPAQSRADIHYVSTNGLSNPPYTSWQDASTNIQMAVDAAGNGDRIIIGDGTYYVAPTNGVTWNATNRHINVSSQNGAGNCIIDCQSKGRGFTFDAGQNTNDILEGLTIKNGKSLATFIGGTDYHGGGAVLMVSASPQIKNCTFVNNQSYKAQVHPVMLMVGQ